MDPYGRLHRVIQSLDPRVQDNNNNNCLLQTARTRQNNTISQDLQWCPWEKQSMCVLVCVCKCIMQPLET